MTEQDERSQLRLVGAEGPLIAADEGSPVELVNPDGSSEIVLICEHASNRVPRSLHGLGLDDETLSSHVAWDPGASPVARLMAAMFDAPLVLQRFSRLVYDCNRPPEAESAMPARSEAFDIPGNVGLTSEDRAARTEALYRPFREKIASVIDGVTQLGRTPVVVTIHSFTPIFHGKRRSVELGLLHDVDTRLVDAMLEASATVGDLVIRRNEPYGPEDGVTHTLQVDAIARGLPNVMFEVRNDLLETDAQHAAMATRLAGLVKAGLGRLPPMETPRQAGAAR